jgi:hypothetical protein
VHLPRELWRPLLVSLDEGHLFAPERGSGESVATQAVIDLATLGRKRGYCLVVATQRLSKLHKDCAAELLNKFIGYTDDVDLQRAGEQLGMTKEQRAYSREQVIPTPGKTAPAPPAVAAPVREQVPRAEREPATSSGALAKGEKTTLIAIAQNHDGATREQLTLLTGYKKSTRNAYIQRLVAAGYAEDGGETIRATDAGIDALGSDYEELPTGDEFRAYWLRKLPEGERKCLEILIDNFPAALQREDLDEPTGYKKSTRNAYIQRLVARKLVDEVGRGEVRANAMLFS